MSDDRGPTAKCKLRITLLLAAMCTTTTMVPIGHAQTMPRPPPILGADEETVEVSATPIPTPPPQVVAERTRWIRPQTGEAKRYRQADDGGSDWFAAGRILGGLGLAILTEGAMSFPLTALSSVNYRFYGRPDVGGVLSTYTPVVLSLAAGAIASLVIADYVAGSRSQIWPIFVSVGTTAALCVAVAVIAPTLWSREQVAFGFLAALAPLTAGLIVDNLLKLPAEISQPTAHPALRWSVPARTIRPSVSFGESGARSFNLIGSF